MKTCKKCLKELPLDSFHKHKGFNDGRRIVCKDCCCAEYRKYYTNNRDRHLETCRAWQDRNREKMRDYQKSIRVRKKEIIDKYKKNNPDRIKAQKSLNHAVFKGDIERLDHCQVCGCKECDVQAHHYDYTKAHDVIWVCTKCHGWIHRKCSMRELEIA